MSRNRASQAELISRRQEIQGLILEGHTNQFIVDRMADKHKTSKRAIQEDIRAIGKDWSERSPEENQLMRNKYADRLKLLFNLAVSHGHVKIALEVQKEIHKLNGLYAEKEENKDEMPKFIKIGKKNPLKIVDGGNE